MRWDFSFFSLVSSQILVPLMDMSKTSSPHNPLHKPIITAATKHVISLFRIFTSPFHSMDRPTNRAFTISLVTPKPCSWVNIICSLYDLTNFTNYGPQAGHSVSVKYLPSFEKCSPPFATLQLHIDWLIPLGLSL